MKWFMDLHIAGGLIFMNFLTLFLLAILVQFCIGGYFLFFAGNKRPVLTKNLILGVIYLGGFSAVWGILAQGMGIWLALSAIQQAADVSPAIIIGGIKASLIAPLYGAIIFLFSSILWFILKTRYHSVSTTGS